MEDSRSIDLSVIIPAYNVGNYIGRCLDSILKQTGIRIEIIVSNDGSTDDTALIVKSYMEKYSNIVLINHENAGVYRNRLIGLKSAHGCFITFCDADDYVDDNGYTELIKIMNKEKIDILEYGWKRVSDAGILSKNIFPEKYFKGRRCVLNALEKRDTQASVCNKIYKRELFGHMNLDYKEFLMYDEDIFTNIQILNSEVVLKRVPFAFYNYYVRNNSITTSEYSTKSLLVIKTNKEIYDYIKENMPDCLQEAAVRYCTRLAWCYCMNSIHKITDYKRYNEDIKKEFDRIYKEGKIKLLFVNKKFYKRIFFLLSFRINPKISTLGLRIIELGNDL